MRPWQSVIYPHYTPCRVHASGGVLSANGGRKYPKSAVKPHGFKILCAAGVPSIWKIFCHANQALKFTAVLSYRFCAYLRDALCACAGCPNGGTFCIYRAWRCGHRPLRNSIGKRSVGAGVPDGPRPALHLTSCEQQCHYETSAHAGRGNP